MSFEEKMKRIADEKNRLAVEEAAMREEAIAELDRVYVEIASLEDKKLQLESLLGIEEGGGRAGHGQIIQHCIKALADRGGGLTSSQVREIVAQEVPGMRVSSVPGTLSRLVSQGRMKRDEQGRYFLA